MKKKNGVCFFKCLKSVAKNRHANQMARAILSAPTVQTFPENRYNYDAFIWQR